MVKTGDKSLLILGAKGMLGGALTKVFADWRPTLWDQQDLDISDEQAVDRKTMELQPKVIINAAAYTNVDGCEQNNDLATRVNGLAVGYLAAAAKRIGATLVHYSTDYVFAGGKKEGYTESDKPNTVNFYGKSKLRGEKELQTNCRQYYLIRTSWLYGPGGKNFVDTILKLAESNKEIKVVNDQFGKLIFCL